MVVFHPGAMFPSQNTWNGETNELATSVINPSDYQVSAFDHLQDGGVAQNTPNALQQVPPLAAVSHVFKQQAPDDGSEYAPEAKRLAYAPSPFVNKSPGSPYCENGSIASPMSVAAASGLEAAYHQSMQPAQQHHQLDQGYDQSQLTSNDLTCANAAAQQLQSAQYSADHFNPLSPFAQQQGHTLNPNAAAAAAHASMMNQQQQQQSAELSQAHSNALAAHSANLSQLSNYPPMSSSPRNYLTPSPLGSVDSASALAVSNALNRYGPAASLYVPQSLANQPSRSLSPVVFSDLAHRQLAAQFPTHYFPAGLPTASGHQMSSMHPSQFPPQAAHGLAPGSLMRMGFPYRYPPSPYFDFRSGHPSSPYHPYQLSNGPNAPPFFRDEFIKPGRKPASPGSVFPAMQSTEVITLGDVCDMKDPDDLSKIVLSNADELLSENDGTKDMATRVLEIESRLCFSLLNLRLSDPVMYIYNPLDYARQIHQTFVLKWGSKTKKVLFLGMNPGPFGMAQNGIPFGDGQFVKNFLKLEKGTVTKPAREHPKRPIWGLECPQREVSGSRFWSLVQSISGHPDAFFNNCYVYNYCPLVFLGMSGKNITPPSLGSSAREPLLQACDKALVDIVNLMGIEKIVAVGRFVEERSKLVLKTANREDVEVIFIMHPSPINPKANAGWESIVKGQLEEAKIAHFFPHFYNPIPVTFSTTASNGPTTSSSCSSSTTNTSTKMSNKESCVVSSNQSSPICGDKSSCDNTAAQQVCKQESLSKSCDGATTKLCANNSSFSNLSEAGSESSSASQKTPTSHHPLVGQLSIASEASTFADEFIKAEVTITSNALASNPPPHPPSHTSNPVDHHLSPRVKSEPNGSVQMRTNCERSAMDSLIAATEAQQQNLSFSSPSQSSFHQQQQQSSGHPQPTNQTASTNNNNNHQSQGHSLNDLATPTASLDLVTTPSSVNHQTNMMLQPAVSLESNNALSMQQSHHAFFANHKMAFASNPMSTQSMPHSMTGSPYMPYGTSHAHIMQSPNGSHYNTSMNSYNHVGYPPGAADIYHLSHSPLYSPHYGQFSTYSMGGTANGAPPPNQQSSQYNSSTDSPQTMMESNNVAAINNHLSAAAYQHQQQNAAAAAAANGSAANSSYFNQSANGTAAQYDCYSQSSNLLS